MVHELKTWPLFFQAIMEGRKKFELRKADRPFSVGDCLWLREWDPNTETYTGRECNASVTYMLRGPSFGLPKDVCVLSIDLQGPADEQ